MFHCRRLYQQPSAITAKNTPNVLDCRSSPIKPMTVSTSSLTRWDHLVPAFSLCRLGSMTRPHASPFCYFWEPTPATRQHSIVRQPLNVQRSTVRRHFKARHCPLVFSALLSTCLLQLSHKHAAQLYHQLGSRRRQLPDTELCWV